MYTNWIVNIIILMSELIDSGHCLVAINVMAFRCTYQVTMRNKSDPMKNLVLSFFYSTTASFKHLIVYAHQL